MLFQVAREGLRPRIPDNMPPAVAYLLRRCWLHDPRKRPPFPEVRVLKPRHSVVAYVLYSKPVSFKHANNKHIYNMYPDLTCQLCIAVLADRRRAPVFDIPPPY